MDNSLHFISLLEYNYNVDDRLRRHNGSMQLIIKKNNVERIFIIIVACITCGVFGYSINAIGIIFAEIKKKQLFVSDQMKVINGFMKQKNLTQDLQIKIRKYYEYFYQLKSEQQLDS